MVTVEKHWDGNEQEREGANGRVYKSRGRWTWLVVDNGTTESVHRTRRDAAGRAAMLRSLDRAGRQAAELEPTPALSVDDRPRVRAGSQNSRLGVLLETLENSFRGTFGLRAFPGKSFRVNLASCYINDDGIGQVVVEVLSSASHATDPNSWLDFWRGTYVELQRERTTDPNEAR